MSCNNQHLLESLGELIADYGKRRWWIFIIPIIGVLLVSPSKGYAGFIALMSATVPLTIMALAHKNSRHSTWPRTSVFVTAIWMAAWIIFLASFTILLINGTQRAAGWAIDSAIGFIVVVGWPLLWTQIPFVREIARTHRFRIFMWTVLVTAISMLYLDWGLPLDQLIISLIHKVVVTICAWLTLCLSCFLLDVRDGTREIKGGK